jgi:hypothetical protein
VLEQQVHDLLASGVVGRLQAELGEALVLPDQVAGGAGEEPQEPFEGGPVEGLLQVLDDVELDAALAQDVDCAARFPSAGVVVDEHALHGAPT